MTKSRNILALLAATTCLAGPAAAQEDDTLKIGLIFTLSGPAAVLGEMGRDGFLLAAEQIGEIGGMKTEIVVMDDEQKPDIAANKARDDLARTFAVALPGEKTAKSIVITACAKRLNKAKD